MEGGPLPRLPFRPDATSMALDDAAAYGEANARALDLLLGVKALEWLEDPRRAILIEADAIVADDQLEMWTIEHCMSRLGRLEDIDAQWPLGALELDGVGDEVLEELSELALVGDDLLEITDHDRPTCGLELDVHERDHIRDHL